VLTSVAHPSTGVEHEWVAGRGLANGPAERGHHTDLFAILKPKVAG